jgi:predicted nucleic acid-binding protein
VIRAGERAFVDTGAWVALALVADPLHLRAKETWHGLLEAGARLFVSVPVLLETFTFLQRKVSHDVAARFWASLADVPFLERVACSLADMNAAMRYFDDPGLYKLSLVDATSFVLMRKRRLRAVFTFDTHFASAGFRII